METTARATHTLGYFSKWLSFSSAALVMLSAGLAYTFSIYSDALKEHFQLNQTQLAGIGTACNLGGYLALPAGLVYDGLKAHNRYKWRPRKLYKRRGRMTLLSTSYLHHQESRALR